MALLSMGLAAPLLTAAPALADEFDEVGRRAPARLVPRRAELPQLPSALSLPPWSPWA